MNFNDIFKNSFLSDYSYTVDTKTILLSLVFTTVFAVYIFFIYRLITRKTFYSKTFNLSLIAMAIITAAIILTIQSNIVLSLGMVGALSIVRFRTAIKDPLDLVFLYWSISVGIICGAGLTVVTAVLCLIVTVIILLAQKYPIKKLSMILVVNAADNRLDGVIQETVKRFDKHCKVKSKNMTADSLDMVVEINVPAESELLREIMKIEGVTAASILSHDGEITAA